MISDSESFDLSGPYHLTCVDWNNANHQRSVAACLVQGVKILERDRRKNRQGPQALAPPWWEFFGFRLRNLIDDADQSIFGAIYEFTSPSTNGTPHCVIAFRGTLIKGDAFLRDLRLDLRIINGLNQTPRFEIAMQSVCEAVAAFRNFAAFRNSKIWLTGHSLGAAIAMLAGKTMPKAGIRLETFLFNPPFVSAPIGRIKNKNVQQVVRIMRSFLVAGLTVARNARHQRANVSEDPFVALSGWVPRLYVHPDDYICSEYIGYFENRETMKKNGFEDVEKLATQHSLRVLAIWKESEEPLHLIPSADLIVNFTPAQDFIQAHKLRQWWSSDLQLQSKVHKYISD